MAGSSSRNLLNLFNDSQAGDEEDEFFGDGSQVGNYSPLTGFVPPPRPGTAGFFDPAAAGVVHPAAAGFLPPRSGGFSAPPAPPFMDPPAPEGLDLNSQAAVFPGLGDYQRVLQSDEAPARRRSGKHVVATHGRGRSAGRGTGGRGSTSSAGIPRRPARSGAARGGGGVARARSLTNAARAQSASRIDVDDDEEFFYGSRSMAADGSNMLLNSDEEEDDPNEVTFAALMCFTIAM